MAIVSSPALAYTNYNEQKIGSFGYGSGYNSQTGENINTTSQQIGNFEYKTINQGGKTTNCTTQTIGSQSYTNCY
jgi:hypothetical protein